MQTYIFLAIAIAIGYVLYRIVKMPPIEKRMRRENIEFDVRNGVLLMRSTGGRGFLLFEEKVLAETDSTEWTPAQEQSSWFKEVVVPMPDHH